MSRIFILLLLVKLLYSQQWLTNLYEKSVESVVVILNYGYDSDKDPQSVGSGFIVSPNGIIITNYHVINDADSIYVYLPALDELRYAKAFVLDDKLDFAILKVEGINLKTVQIGDAGDLKIGHEVASISTPAGIYTNTLSKGNISNLYGKENFIQFTADISPGSSGGPLFNTSSEVIGITTLADTINNNIYFALPINLIMEDLEPYLNYNQPSASSVKKKATPKKNNINVGVSSNSISSSSIKIKNYRAKDIFSQYCQRCHNQGTAGGDILKDPVILNKRYSEIYAIIENGVPAKNKYGFKGILSSNDMRLLGNYILSEEND